MTAVPMHEARLLDPVCAPPCFFVHSSVGRDYIVATTKLMNGNSLLESVTETVWNRLKKNTINK